MYYYHLDWSNTEEYTNYFNNEFIPKHIPDFNQKQPPPPWRVQPVDEYWIFYPNKTPDPKILELQNFLKSNFDFPDISYFLIFYQLRNYEIHIDGPGDSTSGTNHTSLNLQLSGYEGTKMEFYETDGMGHRLPGTHIRAWDTKHSTLVDQFDCTNTWTLINTGVPHQLVVPQTGIPKICLSIRFKGFPAFEDSLAKIKRNNPCTITI
jgi:hypothetical protein